MSVIMQLMSANANLIILIELGTTVMVLHCNLDVIASNCGNNLFACVGNVAYI